MSEYILEKYLNTQVIIKNSDKAGYRRKNVIGMLGIIEKISGSSLGVRIDGIENEASSYGLFWFSLNELKKNEGDKITMKKFNYAAVVKLEESSKYYYFALHDEDKEKLETYNSNMVIVNPIRSDNRVIGLVKNVITKDEFMENPSNKNIKITAEVIGVVDCRGYDARIKEKERLEELAKRKVELRKKLDAEIERRKTLEFYERMAQEYSDNVELVSMVEELKILEKDVKGADNEQRETD